MIYMKWRCCAKLWKEVSNPLTKGINLTQINDDDGDGDDDDDDDDDDCLNIFKVDACLILLRGYSIVLLLCRGQVENSGSSGDSGNSGNLILLYIQIPIPQNMSLTNSSMVRSIALQI